MKKNPIILILVLLFSKAYAQSETHNFITYDTTIKSYRQWSVRISRPVGDTAERPAIFFIPGQGEMNKGYSALQTYGPHYCLSHGWDGSIKLSNGTHYPLLFTIISDNTYMSGMEASDCIDILLKTFAIKKNSVHVAGLSQGAFALSGMLLYSVNGDDRGMKKITSLVCLEGASNEISVNQTGSGALWGRWAKVYGGKFFGLEGYHDYRVVSRVSKPMNDSVPGSAYFSYETLGAGEHCCWNQMVDPGAKNWKSVGAPLGTYNTGGADPNMMGTYKTGDNIFTWMFKQGDTSMVGASIPVPTIYYNAARADTFKTVCPAGYVAFNTVVYVVPAKKYSSTLSQQDADDQAKKDAITNGQQYADQNGQCKKICAILYPPLLGGKSEIVFEDGTTLIQQ